jgi:hypothetical protein
MCNNSFISVIIVSIIIEDVIVVSVDKSPIVEFKIITVESIVG